MYIKENFKETAHYSCKSLVPGTQWQLTTACSSLQFQGIRCSLLTSASSSVHRNSHKCAYIQMVSTPTHK